MNIITDTKEPNWVTVKQSAEPVAWFEQDPDMKSVWYQADKDAPNAIPLYTHPAKPLSNVVVASATCRCGTVMEVTNLQEVKTLTDEEIEKVRIAIMNTAYWCADENMSEAYNAVKVCCSEVLAILEKARGK